MGLIPDLPGHLGGDDWTFCHRTVQALLWSALTDEPPHVVSGALRRLGAANQVASFPEGQYLGLAHALLRAVRELTDDDWSTTLGSAWISYFQWIQGHLVAGASRYHARRRRRPRRSRRPPGCSRRRTVQPTWSRWPACSRTRTTRTPATARSWSR